MSTPQPMSAAQDKAFKREAMRTPDASRNQEVSRWIDSYVPPEKIQQAKAEPPKQRYYERRRAELVEQKARVKALLEHRARALKATAHYWPQYRDMATHNENARISKEVQRRERMRLAAEAEKIPPDICHEIAQLSSPPNIAALCLVSLSCASLLRPLLYREVTVGDRANELVRTLANVRGVAPLVKSLTFEGSLCAYIPDAEWAEALLLLQNLRHLTISHHVPLEWSSLPFIRFKLLSFTSHGLVIGAWAGLLHLQPELEELCLHSDFLAQPPGRDALPVLRRLTAPTAELSKFAALHPLEGMVFAVGSPWASTLKTGDMQRFANSTTQLVMLRIGSSQLLRLFRDMPNMVAMLRQLAVDEDKSWARNTAGEQRSLMRVATKIEKQTPLLESFRLDIILAELARLGGGGPTQSLCTRCSRGISRHHCLDCFWAECLCATCLVGQHAEHPLHRIETWIGGRWVRQDLKTLGLRIQLGHGAGGQCMFPVPKAPFFIVDRYGIQEVALDFCGCDCARTRSEQLRQARLLATTQVNPGSAIAFDLADAARKQRAPQQLPVSAENAEHLALSPPPLSRPNLWPTPFVPAVEQSWRRRRPRSQPIGAETAERVRAALERGGAAAATEEFWTSAMCELADWAYDPPPLLEEPQGECARPYIDVDQIEQVWAMPNTSTREMSPSVRRDVLEGRSDGERPETGWAEEESRWGSDQ
ncbi:hypothetical protein DFH09DRAFT_1340524 [Mycena vulgaris]|nr:hypothetical protein DFH09DRAFT_1340524 [Mycena vulgaris]